ncbi:T-cell surface glycoprotein CD8 alpha chain [Cebidichthys violaceus]|uniref:T-cell surface glycoprotein CD8 alpha chain n=1 Tax=Cebidichthys violaceus TaxID=271503 RepID=UPI0035CA95D5
MNQKWILVILVILVFCQKITSGAGEEMQAKEGQPVEIKCRPGEVGTMIVWFRVLDNDMEFLASFSKDGFYKSSANSFSTFSYSRMRDNILTLQSFNKTRDSGIYSCASLNKGNTLQFGKVTRLVGEKVEVALETTQATIIPSTQCTTATPCVCNKNEDNKQGESSPQMFCSPIILGSLAASCGLLLLLLIIATLYCNRIRTRRCPHHYKRKPRMAPGKQMMTNRHV